MSKICYEDGWDYLVTERHPEIAPFFSRYFDREAILKGDAISRGGRGQTLLYETDGLEVVMRHFRRGGLLGRILKDGFFVFEPHAHRAFDEFRLLEEMRSQGLPVPEPLLAREKNIGGMIVQDILISRIHARDLSFVLRERSLSKTELLRLGSVIKAFFDGGIEHTDLNIRNILLDDEGRFFIIDFDKCFKSHPDAARRRGIVDRLHRSFLKEARRFGDAVHYEDQDFALIESSALNEFEKS